jgi:hypothetical protein
VGAGETGIEPAGLWEPLDKEKQEGVDAVYHEAGALGVPGGGSVGSMRSRGRRRVWTSGKKLSTCPKIDPKV